MVLSGRAHGTREGVDSAAPHVPGDRQFMNDGKLRNVVPNLCRFNARLPRAPMMSQVVRFSPS